MSRTSLNVWPFTFSILTIYEPPTFMLTPSILYFKVEASEKTHLETYSISLCFGRHGIMISYHQKVKI